MASIDELIAQISQSTGGAVDVTKVTALIGPVMEQIQSSGGINALLGKLRDAGFTDQVNSWLSAGSNLTIDPEALSQVIGVDKIKALATQSGLSIEQVKTSIADILPGIVDTMSPGGSLPTSPQDLVAMLGQIPGGDQISSALSNLLGGSK